MYAPVFVVEPAAFEAWLQGQGLEAVAPSEMTPAQRGGQLAEERGCLSCHSVDGSEQVGPTWLDLFGSERQLEDGTTVVADEEYIRTSTLEPQSQLVAGYPNVMPAAYSSLSEEELQSLVEYMRSLSQ
jgi:cytochrome c oxidase subunit 2